MRARAKFLRRLGAWTLIELIAVLAVIAILSAALLPALLRQLDRAVADQEIATLKSFGAAFEGYVLTTRTIPDQTTWYSAIASKLGVSTNDVLYNPHQQSHQGTRVFLIDGALRVGNGADALPYYQASYFSSNSAPTLPTSPRIMIVSSLGKALPGAITSGVLANAYFSNLWNTADGTIPADAAWVGWTGDPSDVKVQRIDLRRLFVYLLLGNYNSSGYGSGYYAIDGVDSTNVPIAVASVGVNGYVIQNTVLSLYNNGSVGTPVAKQILTRDASYVFEQGVWRGSIIGAALAGVGNIGDVVDSFMLATPNVRAANTNGNAQQVLAVNGMLTFMSNYNVWAAASFPDASKASMRSLQESMMTAIQGLYRNGGGKDYSPTNPSACY